MKGVTTQDAIELGRAEGQTSTLIADEVEVATPLELGSSLICRHRFVDDINPGRKDIRMLVGQREGDVAVPRAQVEIALAVDDLAEVQETGQMTLV